MKNIIYENQVLRNTNYYLLCTIYKLEKQKIDNYTECLKKLEIDKSIDEPQFEIEMEKEKEDDPLKEENLKLMNKLEEKKEEYDVLHSELQNLKIQMEVQKDFSEHKILNLELAKNLLEQELLDKREKYENLFVDKREKNDSIDNLEQQETCENQEELIKKGKEIDKLKRENAMLTINNQQLQYELIRTIKQMQ